MLGIIYRLACQPIAREMLGIEERKEEARNSLETATQSRSLEMKDGALTDVGCYESSGWLMLVG